MNKSTKRRLITSIICFTACASLVGVGFSLWTAGSGSASASGEGDLVTDDFSKIKINNSISVDPFCQAGFLIDYNHGYELSYTGNIYALIEFDLSEFVRSTDMGLDVSVTLTNQYFNSESTIQGYDFSNASKLTYGQGDSSTPTLSSTGTLPSGTTLTQTISSENIPSKTTKYYFAINIEIVSEAANFKTDVYDKLIDRTFKLNTVYTIK